MEQITLTDEQVVNVNRLVNILYEVGAACDFSFTGRGKTPSFCQIMKQMEIQIVILICPKSIVEQWKAHFSLYSINFLIITYETLRGINVTENTTLQHNLLIRTPDGSFYVTDYFRHLVENNSIVVAFDEFQNLKNKCDKQKAATALAQYIEHRRRIFPINHFIGRYYMSATPFDKEEHVINFNTTSGLIISNSIVDLKTNSLEGLFQLRELCLKLDINLTNRIWGMYEVKPNNAENIAYELNKDIILPRICSFIKEPLISESKKQRIYYNYVNIPKIAEDTIKIGDSFIHSRSAINISPEINQFYSWLIQEESPLNNRNGITHGQIVKQTVMAKYGIVPYVFQAMNQVPNVKIVIFLSYKEAIGVVARNLQMFNPIVITGDDKIEVREKLKTEFQEHNLNRRILITMNQISAVGVEFDDTHGNFPRIGFSIPTHIITDAVQSPGRLDRKRTMSNSLFFLAKIRCEENLQFSVEKSTEEKSKILTQTLRNSGILPPNCFETIENLENYNLLELLQNIDKNLIKKEEVFVEQKQLVIKQSSLAAFRARRQGM